MEYNDEILEKPIIVIDEKPEVIPGQGEGETPVIVIERVKSQPPLDVVTVKPRRHWPWMLAAVFAAILLGLAAIGGYWYYRHNIYTGISVSVTSEQNIAWLSRKAPHKVKPEVVMTSDSILGVGLNLYEMRGLVGEICYEEPTDSDASVFLYSRCSDITSYIPEECKPLGSLVMNGKVIHEENNRLGYCAMANGNTVIGVARDEDVMEYCAEHGGNFFRQFVLVSDWQLPANFHLHGKVERRAIGRLALSDADSGTLYYIESHGKEGMYEFADALRAYGFRDAIYITGGTDYCFYRDAEGVPHDIGDTNSKGVPHKGQGLVPWLVFRRP